MKIGEKAKTQDISKIKSGLSHEQEQERKDRKKLAKQAIQRLVKDFNSSLRTPLDRLGDCNNAEKHVNELVHRANFRFSDL
jgi:hypothetical protein